MINILIGPPGGGKSFEAVVFHVLPALKKGRKVITNLPLVLSEFLKISPEFEKLIDVRVVSLAGEKVRPFSDLQDYADAWRHPETGSGPLYVIDECHEAIPRMTASVPVMEWFAKHRHESADVLLVTQSYGKLHADIRDMIQLVYRVKKATAFGSQTSYIRKVQDGLRGDVVNTTVRKYDPKFFKLYQSHTKGGGQELEAQDVKPIWFRWPFIGTALCFSMLAVMAFTMDFKNPFDSKSHSGAVALSTPSNALPRHHVAVNPIPVIENVKALPPSIPEPFDGRGLHLVGQITWGNQPTRVIFAVSQGGQGVSMVQLDEVLKAGYSWTQYGPCSGTLEFMGKTRSVICDAPTVSVQVPMV